MATKMAVRALYTAVVALAFVWLAAIFAAPRLMCGGYEMSATLLYRTFALICHQRAERSFHWCGWPLAVCVRCTGIYVGGLCGVLFYPLWRGLEVWRVPQRKYLLLALVPLALDWGLGVTGVIVNNTGSRMVTGWLVGVVAAYYVLPALLAAGAKQT